MTTTATHAPGTFCWADLGTTDPAAAKRFYAALFDWSSEDRPMGNGQFYTMFDVGGRHIGALYPQPDDQKAAGIPPNWLSYLAVENADAAAARATQLGGKVCAAPFDVQEAGRMAVVQDPTGAVFAIWEARNHLGAGVIGEPGAICWNELMTSDVARAGEFYRGLFGWGENTMPMEKFTYTTFMRGDQMAGGMMPVLPEWGPMASHWGIYIQTDDVDASAARAGQLGATVVAPPADIPQVGRFAMIRDPQGGMFSLFKPLQR
jgi:predicted enzyme related to lactoylglutathione lyase